MGAALAVLAIGSIRQIPWFALALAPLLADDIGALLRATPGLSTAIGWVRGPLGDRRATALLIGTAALCVVFQPMRLAFPPDIARITPDAPVEMADTLSRLLPGNGGDEPQRILNEQVWGGYLSYRFGDGSLETAMDGRLEIRHRQTWIDYFDLMHGVDDPAGSLEDGMVRWAMIDPSRTALEEKLLAAGWRVVVRDSQGTLLRRD